ncbi:MAG TPA: Ig-like domain-containing protein [Anaerolineaceae bacterium]
MKTKAIRSIVVGLLLALVCTAPALAQAALNLDVRKDFGYNLGNQIRGTFSMRASGPADLQSVTFLIDSKAVGKADAAPFAFQFQTANYAVGMHELSATGVTAGGQSLTSPVKRFEFVSAQAEQNGMGKVVVPLLGLIAGIFVVMMLFQFVLFRGRKREPVPLGTERQYGIRGGAICPRCGRPTPIHWSAMNMGITTKLDFCDNCGRYGLLHRRPLAELRRAEQAELLGAQAQSPVHAHSAEETLKEQLDSSRFEEM